MDFDEVALEERAAGGASQTQVEVPPSQRIVIKQANLTIQVQDVDSAESLLRSRAEQLGGFVVSVRTVNHEHNNTKTSFITFRVRAEHFDEALSGIEGLAHRVISRSVTGDDVTEEFVDISARLRSLETTRDRLLDLLARADEVEDALQVNRALTDLQSQIEQIQGRINYLRDRAALSTINVELRPIPARPPIIDEDSWQPLIVASDALSALISLVQWLINVGIILLVWIPVWLPILLLGRWWLGRK
ncbi:DUF4349 domain-containing protein [Candidatus Viridilinea mediisalina]|nr:DUF4349 domain-containing protein [Candidatus Viridilinea mediisalina]